MFASFRRFLGTVRKALDPASRLVKSLSTLTYKQMENLLDQLQRGYNRRARGRRGAKQKPRGEDRTAILRERRKVVGEKSSREIRRQIRQMSREERNKAKKEGSNGVSALWELNIFVRIIPNVMNN